MKRAISMICCLMLLLGLALAEEALLAEAPDAGQPAIDMKGMSLDELIELRDQLNAEIESRGVATRFDLQRGDKGDDVAKLQERLAELGFYGGAISGKFDTETQKAVKQFEKANGLENDGMASREDQAVLFSDAAVGKNAGAGAKGEKAAPTREPEDERYAEYGDFDYTEMFRYPDDHLGEKVKFIGKVVQVIGSRKEGIQLRVATAGSSDVVYVFLKTDPGYNILENDRLTIYGTFTGTVTYQSVWNASVTIPSVEADEVVLR